MTQISGQSSTSSCFRRSDAHAPETIINGQPTDWGNPLPWRRAPETPNLGSEDETDDLRPGLGRAGVAHLHQFARDGGLLMTSMDTANLAVSAGMTPGVTVGAARNLKIVGSVVRSRDRRRG